MFQALPAPGSKCQDVDQQIVHKKDFKDKLIKTRKRQTDLPSLIITKSAISLYSWEEMVKIAGPIKITNDSLTGYGSVNDPRMGAASDPLITECPYCQLIDCPGHYGLIEFGTPIYNPAFIREIVAILTCVCNDCGGLLITEDLINRQGFVHLSFEKRLGKMEDYCKDQKCLRQKPQIGTGVILPCVDNPIFVTTDIKEKGEITYKLPEPGNKKVTKEDPIKLMPISIVMQILNLISENDARLLGFPLGSHPRNMIMMGCLVPPLIARFPLFEGGTKYHDKLTHIYVAIKRKVNNVSDNKPGAIGDLYSIMKQLIFKSETNKLGIKDFRSIIERIQGKTALLRGLLMGKRVNFAGRTVAGPDPSLRFGEIRIPSIWSTTFTKKVFVTDFNIRYLQDLFDNKKISHIILARTGLREFYGNRPSYRLQIGDKVERWLQNGDLIPTNRQPTLHRLSMMGYNVVLGKALTIGLHLSYTSPMNCDFDGDENNAWVPQDLEVEAEVEAILHVKANIISAEQNRPVMGLVMNSISAAFLLTKYDCILGDTLFSELLDLITMRDDLSTLNARLKKWKVHNRSGAAIFSALLPATLFYVQKGVVIIEGILISGRLRKSSVGASHRSIIQDLYTKYGYLRTSDFFTDAPWVLNKWIMERGFSVGLLDMVNLVLDPKTGKEYDKNQKILKQELAQLYIQFEALGDKLSDPNEEAYRTRQLTGLSDIANGIGIRLANNVLTPHNSIGIMTEKGAGTKGAVANIGQMMGAVGQQFYQGERLKPTITGGKRLLPCYDEDDSNPEAHAFIPTSFFTGLDCEGLFFLQSGGREAILDTALKTQETGSLSHKMVKAFENIVISYDGSIRNTIGTLFSPVYNSGYDTAEMMMVDYPGKSDFSSFVDVKSLVSELNIKRGWVPENLSNRVTADKTPIPYKQSDEFTPYTKTLLPITKFEKSRIIGARAMQLSHNDKPLVPIGEEIDPIKIALKEYKEGFLKLYIVRKFADGSYQKVYPTVENQNN
jgi:DNA-directed RNA polymerase II subunit RPB1